MRNPVHLALTTAAIMLLAAPPAPAQEAPKPADILKALTPRERVLVVNRAKRCLKLPDGSIADITPYYQIHDAVADCARRITPTKPSSGLSSRVQTGPPFWEWASEREPAVRAWGLQLEDPRGDASISRTGAGDGPGTMSLPRKWAGEPAYYIDADKPDPLTRYRKIAGVAVVGSEFAGGIVEVDLRSPGYRPTRLHVLLPNKNVVRKGALTGKFVLWPDQDAKHPRGAGAVHRYIPAADLAVPPEELATKLATGEWKLYDWSFSERPSDRRIIWVQQAVTLASAPPVSALAAAPAPAPPAPAGPPAATARAYFSLAEAGRLAEAYQTHRDPDAMLDRIFGDDLRDPEVRSNVRAALIASFSGPTTELIAESAADSIYGEFREERLSDGTVRVGFVETNEAGHRTSGALLLRESGGRWRIIDESDSGGGWWMENLRRRYRASGLSPEAFAARTWR